MNTVFGSRLGFGLEFAFIARAESQKFKTNAREKEIFLYTRQTLCLHGLMAKIKRLSAWQKVQKNLLYETFLDMGKDISATAVHLGLSRPTVLRKLRDFGLYAPLRRGK